jgi:hypothetical protein
LLWDGTAFLGGSDLDLGKVVIVLAGSGAAVDRLMTLAQQMRADLFQEEGKLVDLLSRINGGVIRVPDLDRVERGRNRKVDKVCITIALLRGRFGSQLKQVPWSLLHFVAVSRFRYGVRSIAHFVDTIPVGAYTAPDLALAPNSLDLEDEARLRKSSLVYHLVSDEGGYEIVNNWKEANSCKASVVIA